MRTTEARERAAAYDAEETRASDRDSHCSRCCRRIAHGADLHAPACRPEEPVHREGDADAEKEERAEFQRGLDLRCAAPRTQRNSWKLRRAGLNKWLPKKERQATSEYEHRDAGGDIVDLRPRDEECVNAAERGTCT